MFIVITQQTDRETQTQSDTAANHFWKQTLTGNNPLLLTSDYIFYMNVPIHISASLSH